MKMALSVGIDTPNYTRVCCHIYAQMRGGSLEESHPWLWISDLPVARIRIRLTSLAAQP